MSRRENASGSANEVRTAPALFLRIVLIMVLAEALVMAILHVWGIAGPIAILVDPLLLALLATPLLFFVILRPLHRMARELARANAAKQQFLASLSHELRTPLTPVLAAAGRLERDAGLDAETRADLAMICRNVALEARLIDDLLDVTRISAGKLQLHPGPVDAAEVLRQALAVCEPDLKAKHLRVQLRIEPPSVWVQGDVVRLQQIFWNLIRNAAKFTAEGGAVVIRCRNDEEGGRLVVEVSDTGIGIDAQALPRIFDAFEQGGSGTTHRFGGLGLGLAIARHLVELHGGSIEAHSAGAGKGATFRIALPTIAAPPAPPSVPLPPPLPQSSSPLGTDPQCPQAGLHLLLVEDHADTARIVSRLLKRQGYDVRAAGSVQGALELAEQEHFDLVISDLGLPDGNGHDLMRLLHSVHGSLKGIAVSGYGMEDDIRRSREAGFLAHLTKPIDFEQLLATLGHVASGRSAWDPNPPQERRLPC